MIETIKFGEPFWLNLMWGAAARFVLIGIYDGLRRRRIIKKLGAKGEFLTGSVSSAKRRWHVFLQCLALACFSVAMARPLLGSRQQEIKQTGIEMIIAVDVSNSMMAEDDKPTPPPSATEADTVEVAVAPEAPSEAAEVATPVA